MTETDDVVDALLSAYETRRPIDPISETRPGMDIGDAYRIQQKLADRWRAQGKRVAGRKIGLTAAAMQRQLGVGQPDFGVVTDDMVLDSGDSVRVDRFLSPRVEPELAFIIGTPLSGVRVRSVEVLDAVAYVAPALEIIDSRIRNWRIGIVDTIADNASSGAVVVGEPVAVDGLDLRGMGCILRRDGEVMATGAGGSVLGSPLRALTWLVRTLADYGEGLEAGDLVIPGSMTPAQTVTTGAVWSAQLAGVGNVSVDFSEGD